MLFRSQVAPAFAVLFLLAIVPTVPAGPSDPTRHVVLVHGIHDTAWTLRKLDRSLTAAGFTTHVVTYSPNNASVPLEESARQMQTQIDDAIPPDAPYSIVAFSMGGLVSRFYTQRLADAARIKTLVTIATPHHGTWLAHFGFSPGVRQMRPGSVFLRDLDSDVDHFHHVRWITIRTPLDLMILPSSSSKLPWAQNLTYPVLIHPLLVWDNRVIHRTIQVLQESPATSPRERK